MADKFGIKPFGVPEKDGGIKDVFGISPNMALQYNRDSLSLQSIFDTYGFTNFWTSENITISGTDTTLHDYASEHDLANPAASNQPTYNASSANFGGKPSFTFDGSTDYFYKSVSGWRGADTTGVFIFVFRVISGTSIIAIDSADESTALDYVFDQVSSNTLRFNFVTTPSGTRRSMRGSTNISSGSFVGGYATDGSQYYIHINASADTITPITGANDGSTWMDTVVGRDNISIGNLVRTTNAFANIEWVAAGYMPFTNVAAIVNAQNDLKTYYGI